MPRPLAASKKLPRSSEETNASPLYINSTRAFRFSKLTSLMITTARFSPLFSIS